MDEAIKKRYWIIFGTITLLLIADQWLKIWIKTHLQIGDEIPLIGDWCKLLFVENEGMAWGFSFGGVAGKYILSTFRLVASGVLLYIIVRMIKHSRPWLSLICIALIFTGAVGNLIDSCFYGLVFDDSYYQIADFVPWGTGYAPFLQGRVVDMFYFPLIDSYWPQWVPFVGGKHLEFFNAVFNIADACITVGVIVLLIHYLLLSNEKKEEAVTTTANAAVNSSDEIDATSAANTSATQEQSQISQYGTETDNK